MYKYIKIFIAAVVPGIIIYFVSGSNSQSAQLIISLAAAILSAAVASLYEIIDDHGWGFTLWLKSKVCLRNTTIRLSFSYLYRIEVDGKYLLVRGNRMKNRYQPVGGVYKYYPEAKAFLDSINALPDTQVGNQDETDDLRLQIKGKNLIPFMDWFASMKDRELDPLREFYEELIANNVLSEDLFRHLKYRKIGTHNVGITYSEFHSMQEMVYADIFTVSLNESQKECIRMAVNKNPEIVVLASHDEIMKRRYNNSVEANLGNNVSWILGEE